jgi:hypothetical protein
VTLNGHVDWAVEHLAVDSALGTDELVALARAAAALDPEQVSSATLPVVPYPADVNRLAADPEAAPATVAPSGEPLPARDAGAGGPASPEALPGGAVVDPC